jgi:hypothetical protein
MMILAFFLVVLFTSLLWFRRKIFDRKYWLIGVTLAVIVSIFLAFISVRFEWRPDIISYDIPNHPIYQFSTSLWKNEMVSKLSYPLFLNVYHTPDNLLWQCHIHSRCGNASFQIFLATKKVGEVKGIFKYLDVPGMSSVVYDLDFPLFKTESDTLNKPHFFVFLVSIFTLFNLIGGLGGVVFTRTLIPWLKTKLHSSS